MLCTGMWKQLNFCGSRSTLKKETGSRSKLGSIWLFEEPEAEIVFIKQGAEMWKWLSFCGSRSTVKKETGSGSKLGSIWLFEELEAEVV